MNYQEVASQLIKAINARRTAIGLKDDEPGKLILVTTSHEFNDWVNEGDRDNATQIAMGAKCPLFQHRLVNELPADPDAVALNINGVKLGFVVDRLDEEAWQRKRF